MDVAAALSLHSTIIGRCSAIIAPTTMPSPLDCWPMRYPARPAMSKSLIIAIGASLALAACGGKPRIEGLSTSPATKPKGPVADWPVKIGSPYQVLGRWYYPKNEHDYEQIRLEESSVGKEGVRTCKAR